MAFPTQSPDAFLCDPQWWWQVDVGARLSFTASEQSLARYLNANYVRSITSRIEMVIPWLEHRGLVQTRDYIDVIEATVDSRDLEREAQTLQCCRLMAFRDLSMATFFKLSLDTFPGGDHTE